MRKRESRKSKRLLPKTVFAHWSYLLRMKASECRECLRDDSERADLLRLAQGVQYPVYLDVTLRGDRVDAVTSAFASRGFSLSVQEKTDNPDDGLNLAGYMKDGLVEEQAFSAVPRRCPGTAGASRLEPFGPDHLSRRRG